MSKKLKIGVVFGGRSGEHEVSIVSAQSVMKALDKTKYEVIPIGITKQGKWIAGVESIQLLKDGVKNLPFKSVLPADPTERRLIKIGDIKGLNKSDRLSFINIDVIFPVLHGTYGEDGTLQGMLELANIPYVGSEVLGSAVAMDKVVQKQILKQSGFPIGPYVWFLSKDFFKNKIKIIKHIEKTLKYPVFTKPANLGSSVAINKCKNQKQLIFGIAEAAKYDRKVLVEQGINSAREIETSVLGNDEPEVAVLGEIISSNEFYDYDAKYVDGKSREEIPAKLPKPVTKRVQALALDAFKTLNLSGLARIDFFVTKKTNQIYINEANTMPGFTSISMYPKMWAASGLSYPKLLDRLIELAIQRHSEKNKVITEYQPKADWFK